MQLPCAAVRPGLEQGLLAAPLSLDQDAGAPWAPAGGLPARLPVWQAGNIRALHTYFTNFFWIAGLGELVDSIPQVWGKQGLMTTIWSSLPFSSCLDIGFSLWGYKVFKEAPQKVSNAFRYSVRPPGPSVYTDQSLSSLISQSAYQKSLIPLFTT